MEPEKITQSCTSGKKKTLISGILYVILFFAVIGTSAFAGRYFSGAFTEKEDNLLLGTNRGTYNFSLDDNGYDATLSRDGKGVKVRIEKHPDSGWLVLKFDDDISRKLLSGPVGDVYTLSFEAKSNIPNATIIASHRQGDSQENQITFGTATIETPETWTSFSLTGTLRGVAATSQTIYLNLKNNPAGTEINIRNLKLEKINLPATDNLLYGTNLGLTNFSLIQKGFDATLEPADDGIGVKVTAASRDDSGWLVLFFDDGNSRKILYGPEGASYTISFDAKANTSGAKINVSHRQGNGQGNQIDFGTAIIDQTNQWQTFTFTGTLKGVPATTQGVYFNLKSNPPGTEISIRNLKITRGTHQEY